MTCATSYCLVTLKDLWNEYIYGMNICMYVRMYVCMYVCKYICTYERMYVCMYVRTYVCMYVFSQL